MNGWIKRQGNLKEKIDEDKMGMKKELMHKTNEDKKGIEKNMDEYKRRLAKIGANIVELMQGGL